MRRILHVDMDAFFAAVEAGNITHTHAVTLAAPTNDLEMIRHAAVECLRRFALVKKVRLVGVRVSRLTPASSNYIQRS